MTEPAQNDDQLREFLAEHDAPPATAEEVQAELCERARSTRQIGLAVLAVIAFVLIKAARLWLDR